MCAHGKYIFLIAGVSVVKTEKENITNKLFKRDGLKKAFRVLLDAQKVSWEISHGRETRHEVDASDGNRCWVVGVVRSHRL